MGIDIIAMPSKEQKKINKREQNEIERCYVQEKMMEELEWEKGTDNRGNRRKELQHIKQTEKLRRKKERQEILDEEDKM